MTQLLLSYPSSARWKRAGTSQESAEKINPRVPTIRERVLAALRVTPGTPDEISDWLGESILTVRPRCSELLRLGKVKETGERRPNRSGHSANVLAAI